MNTKENLDQENDSYDEYDTESPDDDNPSLLILFGLFSVIAIGVVIYCIIVYPIENIVEHKKELLEKGKILGKVSTLLVCWLALFFMVHVVNSFIRVGNIPLVTTITMLYIPTWITGIFVGFIKPQTERISELK